MVRWEMGRKRIDVLMGQAVGFGFPARVVEAVLGQ